ncbi:MAG: proprotein convertase P-domain-containing protein [Pikeienuella sp.]
MCVKSFAAAVIFVMVGASAANAATYYSSDTSQVISSHSTITSTLVAEEGEIGDINLILSDIRHTSVADLRIALTGPNGASAMIIDWYGGRGIFQNMATPDHFIDTVIDDQALVNLRDATAPHTGSFNVDRLSIQQPLSTFVGTKAGGVWTLTISDLASGDTGMLSGWGLEITAASSVSAVPLPATGPLLLAGLAGLWGAGRARRKGASA